MINHKRQNTIHVNINADDVEVQVNGVTLTPIRYNIFDSIKDHDLDGVIAYVNAGGDVNIQNNDGYTPLMLAIQNNWDAQDIKKMLDHMPQVDLRIFAFSENHNDPKFGKPIDMAIKQNNTDLVKVLIDYAETLIIGDEISGYLPHALDPKSEIFKIVSSHITFKNYEESAPFLGRLLGAEELEIADSILSQFKTIPNEHHEDLLHNAALHYKNENIVDLLLDNHYVDTGVIPKVMYNLALKDDQSMFEHILIKLEDKKPIIDYLSSYQDQIPLYGKYAELLGIRVSEHEPGTIYLYEVIDTDRNCSNNLNLNFNKNAEIYVNAFQTNDYVHIAVQIDTQPPLIHTMEGIGV